jgi:hypothetical protein
MAVLLFRIPDVDEAQAFAVGLRTPFGASADSTSFLVPSIPGARGYSVQIASPVHAVEQIVVFRAGGYVAMTQLASSVSASNLAPLTPSQAIAMSYEQFVALRHGDPLGSSGHPASSARPPTRVAASESAIPLTIGAIVVILLVGSALALLSRRRRRAVPAPPVPVDPWGQGGVFEAFGAIVPDHRGAGDGADPPTPHVISPGATARTIPALVTPSSTEASHSGEITSHV